MKNNILRSVLSFGLAILMGAQTFASAFSTSANQLQEKVVSYGFYDENCISVIKYDGVPKIQYFYDSKKQLIRENNVIQNKTILYSYDDKGNILNKKVLEGAAFRAADINRNKAVTGEDLATITRSLQYLEAESVNPNYVEEVEETTEEPKEFKTTLKEDIICIINTILIIIIIIGLIYIFIL